MIERKRTVRWWRACLYGGAMVLLMAIVAGDTVAQEKKAEDDSELRAEFEAEYPIVPERVIAKYLEHVKSSQVWELAQTLRLEKVQPEIESWSEKCGFEIEVKTEQLLSRQGVLGRKLGSQVGRLYRLQFQIYKASDGSGGRIPFVSLREQSPAGRVVNYQVPQDRLEELTWKYVTNLRLIHPLEGKPKGYSCKGKTLTTVLPELCELAGVQRPTFDPEKTDAVKLTRDFEGLSIMECLDQAASDGGLVVTFDGKRREKLGRPEWLNMGVSAAAASDGTYKRTQEAIKTKEFPGIVEAMEHWEELLLETFGDLLNLKAESLRQYPIPIRVE